MLQNNIKAIIFDLDGVIIDSENIWDISEQEFLAKRGIFYKREEIKHVITGTSMKEAIVKMQGFYGFSGRPEELASEWLEMVKGLFRQKIEFVSGFREFFENISDKYLTCVATSMDTELLEIVDRKLDLARYFPERIFTAADVGGKGKPAPDIFLYAAQRIGVLPSDCMVIEDAPLGIEAAHRAGMKCIALATTHNSDKLQEADYICQGFQDIKL